MNFLDVRTVLFIHLISDMVSLSVLCFLWIQNRQRFDGTLHWVGDYCCQTVALSLIIARSHIPDWASFVLSNFLVIAGAFLGYLGLERFFGKRSRQIHNVLLLVAFVCIHSYFLYGAPNLSARNLNLSFVLLIICGQCVWLLTYRISPGMRRAAMGTNLVFGCFCLITLVRIAYIVYSPQSDNDYFKTGLFDMMVNIGYQMLLILLSISLALMVNRRLLMELHTQEEKFSKAFHSSPYAITLTRLPDGQFLEINDGFLKMTGYRADEVLGKSSVDLKIWGNDEDRQSAIEELSRNRKVRETEYRFQKKDGETIIGLFSAEIIMIEDTPWALSVIIDISTRKEVEREREKLIVELQEALAKVKTLSGMLPICCNCKKIRDDKGYWNKIETYIAQHADVVFSHGICKECAEKLYPDIQLYDD